MKRTQAQIGRSSKQKGNSNEREVAKILDGWWGVGKFSRTPSSGGWGNKDEFNTCGDVISSDTSFPFHVEIKAREGWVLDHLLISEKSAIWKWWKQTTDECQAHLKPLLIFKRNHIPFFCMLKLANIPDVVVLEKKALIYGELCVILLSDLISLTDRAYWLSSPKEKEAKINGNKKSKSKPNPDAPLPGQLPLFTGSEPGTKRSIF